MIRDEYSTHQLLLISELNRAVVREVSKPLFADFEEKFGIAGALSDQELYLEANQLLSNHLSQAVTKPVTNVYLKAFVYAVVAVLDNFESGFYLFQDSRFLLRSYLTLSRMGALNP